VRESVGVDVRDSSWPVVCFVDTGLNVPTGSAGKVVFFLCVQVCVCVCACIVDSGPNVPTVSAGEIVFSLCVCECECACACVCVRVCA